MPSVSCSSEVNNLRIENKGIRWIPVEEIAKGDVSTVFKVLSSADGKTFCAMKVERLKKGVSKAAIEEMVLSALQDDPNAVQIMDLFTVGEYRCTVMSLTGPDFNAIQHLMNKKFSDSTMIRLAIRSLMAIKSLHERGFLHRDLEPPNLALSADSNSRNVHLLDFGASRRYAVNISNQWFLRPARPKAPFRGSVQYCSPNMHDAKEVGRVDDLWSWVYIFAEMRVYLPWTDSTHVSKYAPRKRTLIDEVLESDPFLKCFLPVTALLKTYKFADRPDYLKIFEILSAKMEEMGVKWLDPMDFDLLLDRHPTPGKAPVQDEKTIADQATAAFSSVVIPGGQQCVLPRAQMLQWGLDTKEMNTKEIEKKKKVTKEVIVEKKQPEKLTEVPSKNNNEPASKNNEVASKQKGNKGKKAVTKKTNTKTKSTTSSQSRHSPTYETTPNPPSVPKTKIEKLKVPIKTNKVKIGT